MQKDPLIDEFCRIFKIVQDYILNSPLSHDIIRYNAKNDPTKSFDLYVDKLICKELLALFPNSRILSEESGIINENLKNPDYTFIIDPIDGSSNLSLKIPIVGSSIVAIKGKKEITLENIDYAFIGNIINGDFFTAIKNKGAFKNGFPIKSYKNHIHSEDKALFLHLNILKDFNIYENFLKKISPKIKHIRILGASVIELIYVIEKRFFAYLNLKGSLTAENFLAAALLLKESGGDLLMIDKKPLIIQNLKQGFSILAINNSSDIKHFEDLL